MAKLTGKAKAKARKAKAQAMKNIKPFIIRGNIVDGKAVYNTSSLEAAQAAFVNDCVKQMNTKEYDGVPTEEDSMTYVMYLNAEDFAAALLLKTNCSPDEAWEETVQLFNKQQSKYPQVGFTYTREEMVELGTEHAGWTMDMLEEGGVWPWPNARATFQKQGDKLVVIETH